MSEPVMMYVAADPDQPGAAWGATTDRPDIRKANARTVARWIREGATILRVDAVTARAMLDAWKPPREVARMKEAQS